MPYLFVVICTNKLLNVKNAGLLWKVDMTIGHPINSEKCIHFDWFSLQKLWNECFLKIKIEESNTDEASEEIYRSDIFQISTWVGDIDLNCKKIWLKWVIIQVANYIFPVGPQRIQGG